MSFKLKISAYVALLIMVVWFGLAFRANYRAAATNGDAPVVPTNIAAITTTNGNAVTTTNGDASATNQEPVAPPAVTKAKPPPAHSSEGAMIAYLAAFVGSIIGLGILIAHDATQFMGTRAVDFLYNDAGEAMRDPEYERAEQVWANGKFLDAIQMMRDYLKKNPREQHAALRIAEIYEKDLHNQVAAALEYEEVLKQKLPAERWGWAAIHLCNLYSKLGKQDQTRALLQRIADEYPKTGAAKKARARLGLADPGEEEVPDSAESMDEQPGELSPEPPPLPQPPDEKSNLPPGFRPKK